MFDIIEKVGIPIVLPSHGILAAEERSDPDDIYPSSRRKQEQKQFINLIPSENFTSQAVLDALGSPMQSTSVGS